MTKGSNSSYSGTFKAVGFRPLRELLPLDTPLTVLVDPSNVCNLKCTFCPTGDPELLQKVGRPKGIMPFDLFCKAIDDLGAFPRQVHVLHLYKDGEPLANKSLAKMVLYAKNSGHAMRVETTTNGALLTPDRAVELIDAGLDGIRISVNGLDDEGYRRMTQMPVKYDAIKSNVAFFFSHKSVKRPTLQVHCKILDTGLSSDEKNFFLAEFSPIADSVHIDSIMGWSGAEGKDLTLGLTPNQGMSGEAKNFKRRVCSEPFMKMAVNFNGDVSVCCVDWAHETTVGNIKTDSLFNIWNGPKLLDFRLKHLKGERETIAACKKCDYVHGLPPHTNFDDLAEELLPVYLNNVSSSHQAAE